MTIVTQHNNLPARFRALEWSAWDADTLDYDSPIGHGPTEDEAIADLREQLEAA